MYLPVGASYGLESSNDDAIYKLNTVSETINEMSKNYKEQSANLEGDLEAKRAFIESLQVRLEKSKENILYDDLVSEDNGLASDIFEMLVDKNGITKEEILSLLENRNEYVLGFEDFDTNMKIDEDINKVVRIINDTYKIGKVNNLWKQKIRENKKVISSQLDGVSRAISNVAQSICKDKTEDFDKEKREIKMISSQKGIDIFDINIEKNKNGRFRVDVLTKTCEDEEECRTYEIEGMLSKVLGARIVLEREDCGLKIEKNVCKQVYVSKDKFNIQIGIAKENKNGMTVSGDCTVQTKLDDGKYLVALSDGMGSGKEARKSSQVAIKMLTRLLSSGFDKDTSLELINSSMYINSKEDSYATLDVAILDLFSGNMEFMKNGACPTFIKNKRSVKVVKSVSLPARNFGPS